METNNIDLKQQPSNHFAPPPQQTNDNLNYPTYPQTINPNGCVSVAVNNKYNYNNNYANNNQYYNPSQNNVAYNSKSENNIQNDKLNVNAPSVTVIEYHYFDNYNLISKFLMKVYGIVAFQFIIIFGLVMIFQIKSIKTFFLDNDGVFWGLMIVSLLFFIVIVITYECCPKLLRSVPCNYILLILITIALAIMCALIGCVYQFEAVCGAITAVLAICIGTFLIGLFDKGENIKFYIIFLVSLLFLGIHYGLMAAIFRSHYMLFLYVTCGTAVYSLYIAIDVLVIKETFSLDDYILASLILTIDIIRLFLFVLKFLGNRGGGK